MREHPAIADPGAGREAIEAHYDTGDAFFAQFLDDTRTYSCALFAETDDLTEAQRAKIDWHLARVRMPRGGRLLDVGCGWGAAMERAITRWRAGAAVGLTLSGAQAMHLNSKCDPALQVRLEDWRHHDPAARYDGVISIGAFEHFVQPSISSRERIATYAAFFAAVAQWLPSGGRLSLQTMAYPEGFCRRTYDRSPFGAFVRERIFPESDLPTLTEILTAAGESFDLVTVQNDRRDYATTLRRWRERLSANRPAAAALVGAERVDEFDRYFRISIGCFEVGTLLLLRLVFERRPLRAGAPTA